MSREAALKASSSVMRWSDGAISAGALPYLWKSVAMLRANAVAGPAGSSSRIRFSGGTGPRVARAASAKRARVETWMRLGSTISLSRSMVPVSSGRSRTTGWNCLGARSRLIGHRREPWPPARMTATGSSEVSGMA